MLFGKFILSFDFKHNLLVAVSQMYNLWLDPSHSLHPYKSTAYFMSLIAFLMSIFKVICPKIISNLPQICSSYRLSHLSKSQFYLPMCPSQNPFNSPWFFSFFPSECLCDPSTNSASSTFNIYLKIFITSYQFHCYHRNPSHPWLSHGSWQ